MEQKQKYIKLLQNILKDDNAQEENINIFLKEFWDRDATIMNMNIDGLLTGIAVTLDYSLWDEEEIKNKRLLDKSYIKELIKIYIEELNNLE
jgi:hypothetical protein